MDVTIVYCSNSCFFLFLLGDSENLIYPLVATSLEGLKLLFKEKSELLLLFLTFSVLATRKNYFTRWPIPLVVC